MSWIVTALVGALAGYVLFGRRGRDTALLCALVGAAAMVIARFVLWILGSLVFGALFAALGIAGAIIRIALNLVLGLVVLYFILRLARKFM